MLVPIILDGENAWEYYDFNGRPFLRELNGRIAQSPDMAAVTVSEALKQNEPRALDRIFPGSWINANFDVWIGAEEDNRAWRALVRIFIMGPTNPISIRGWISTSRQL